MNPHEHPNKVSNKLVSQQIIVSERDGLWYSVVTCRSLSISTVPGIFIYYYILESCRLILEYTSKNILEYTRIG